MSMRSAARTVLDMATRPLLVPIYLLAARLSVSAVRRRRSRASTVDPESGEMDSASSTEVLSRVQEAFQNESPPPSPVESPPWPEVSVVIPVLNGERDLPRCLDSIERLDYPKDWYEVIVADNGSTDRTVEIAREHGARVVVEPKRGAAAARNAGIAAARGEWVAFTDADCVVHPLWLKHLVAAARAGGHRAVGGRILGLCRSAVVRDFCRRECVLDQEAAVTGRLLSFPFAITCNALFERAAVQAVGGFDEAFTAAAAEDVDLGWRLIHSGGTIGYAAGAWIGHPHRERAVDIHGQFYRYGLSEVQLYLRHRDRFRPRELAMHLWIRPVLYRRFWEAVGRWATAREFNARHFWRLVLVKELGHMAGKMEGHRRWGSWRYLRIWTHE